MDDLPRPHPWHDRWRKIADNVLGQRERLAQWHARYLCRRWALEHAGEPPREVLLEGLRAPLPLPGSDLREHFAGQQQARVLMRVDCADEPFAQLARRCGRGTGWRRRPPDRCGSRGSGRRRGRNARPGATRWRRCGAGRARAAGGAGAVGSRDRRAHVAARAARAGEQERG
ncbi:hypothetical protein [Nannocystis exedens]|uniref:hypothetical protein n=1 Tax=Nannocystis exedens TaxID=54 RepID=UPI000BBA0A75|nr:hypothetical protein [Nannocystis exedens]PCC75847.1 hypothetical protein NAEX_08960 [Nannocystis exedens]